MLSKTRFTIPQTTWAYVAILSVLVVGAVMREINLLIILAGMMAGPLLISWQMIRTNLNQLRVRRRLPRGAPWGGTFDVTYLITNHRKHIDTWALVLEDSIRNLTRPEQPVERGVCFCPRVAVGDVQKTSFSARLTQRGRYRFGPIHISTKVPVGLLQGHAAATIGDEMLIYPRTGYLLRRWRQLVRFNEQGQRHTYRRQGPSEGDFFGLRDWRFGDSRRWIHWRSSAKRNDLVVRQFEQQRHHDLVLLLDLTDLQYDGASGAPDVTAAQAPRSHPGCDQEAIELAVSLTATALAEHCRRASGKLTLRIAGQLSQAVQGPAGPAVLTDGLELLAEAIPNPGRQTPFELLGRLPKLHRDDRVVIIRPGPIDPFRWDAPEDQTAGDSSRNQANLGRAVRLDTTDPAIHDVFAWNDPHVHFARMHSSRPHHPSSAMMDAVRQGAAENEKRKDA